MPSYKLTYFNARGRAEISRLIFAAAGVQFTDERLTNWPTGKEDAPLGQIPYLTVDGLKIPQSASIARFLANRFNLGGKDDLEKVKADAIVDTVSDFFMSFLNNVYKLPEPEKPAAMMKFLGEEAPKHLGNIEKLIKIYGSGTNSVGNSLTWADLQIYDITSMMHNLDGKLLEKYPSILAVRKSVESNAKVAAYLKSRPVTQF